MKKVPATAMIWYENSLFFYLVAALFLIGIGPFFLFDKVSFFMMLKQWHHPMVDGIAPYFTWLGDGITYGCFVGLVAWLGTSCRKIMIMSGSFVCMAIVVQLLKRVFFAHIVRPTLLIPLDALHLVNEVERLTDLSFPSGHSATIFTLASAVQLLSTNKKKMYSFIWLSLAIAVGYSRIYLCQHFYTDVYVGAVIGTLSAIVVYRLLIHFNGPDWLDHSAYFFVRRQWRRG